MKRFAAIVVMLSVVSGAQALGQVIKIGELVVADAWARASPGLAKTGAVYLSIANHGGGVDRLIAVATPRAKRAELHMHSSEDGVMKMRSVEAVEIAPGDPAVFAPGGLHIMLFGLAEPLTEGQHFPLALTFAKAGTVTVEVTVEPLGATNPADDQGHATH